MPLLRTLLACWELGKPRLSGLAVFAVVAGVWMAWSVPFEHPPWRLVVGTTVGTFLVAVASSAFNMYREREFDRLMIRTQGRPLPSGRLAPRQVLTFGWVTAGTGLLILFVATQRQPGPRETVGTASWLATLLCALILASYVLVYTPMKRTTPLNTLVGAIPGALPPVVGYVAVTNEITLGAVILFAILFCWQIPHFLAIAWRYREDYARGGFQMLPVVDPSGHRTKSTMLLYVAGLGIASFLPYITQMAGSRYAAAAFCLDVLFFVPSVIAALTRWESAMRMTFLASILYLPLLFLAMVWDRQLP
ncbi:MAG: protoheme IX farnesyltransferase [Planctomycetes bacterium]|nr:protoheme IX farnesyltransferase [Planctomycetota bacterium]